MSKPSISPSQCRAARGLIGLSQEDFAAIAGVNVRTIVALELAENRPTRQTAMRVTTALRNLGVVLLPDEEGLGAGVRLAEPEGGALILRRDVLRGGEEIGVVLRVAGQPRTARVLVEALARDNDTDAALVAFDVRRVAIASAIARKLEAQAVDDDGHVRITASDIAHIQARAA